MISNTDIYTALKAINSRLELIEKKINCININADIVKDYKKNEYKFNL